jgi:hypothetical protein
MIVRQVQLEERSALDWRFSDRNPHHDRQTGQLRKRARRSTVRRAGWNLQVEQEAVTDFSGDERLGGRYGLRNPMESKHPSLHTTGHQEQHTVWATGPSWGRETAVTHGQPRCLADNQTGSLAAVSAVMGPQVRIWHARGQGLTSPQLHARSKPSSGPFGPSDSTNPSRTAVARAASAIGACSARTNRSTCGAIPRVPATARRVTRFLAQIRR